MPGSAASKAGIISGAAGGGVSFVLGMVASTRTPSENIAQFISDCASSGNQDFSDQTAALSFVCMILSFGCCVTSYVSGGCCKCSGNSAGACACSTGAASGAAACKTISIVSLVAAMIMYLIVYVTTKAYVHYTTAFVMQFTHSLLYSFFLFCNAYQCSGIVNAECECVDCSTDDSKEILYGASICAAIAGGLAAAFASLTRSSEVQLLTSGQGSPAQAQPKDVMADAKQQQVSSV